jgi:hypothetical protein
VGGVLSTVVVPVTVLVMVLVPVLCPKAEAATMHKQIEISRRMAA